MKARELLAEIKSRDAEGEAQNPANFGAVLLLSQDPTLARLVACFGNTPLSTDSDPEEECPAVLTLSDRIRWYWARLEPDPVPAWIALAGLPDAPHVRRAVQVCIDNRMVHPDGTVSRWASRYLSGMAAAILGK
jgi:hypothetical protein